MAGSNKSVRPKKLETIADTPAPSAPQSDAPGQRASYEVRLSNVNADHKGREATNEFVISESIAHVTAVTARLFDRMLADRLRQHGVPIGQWPFLLFLWADESLSQRDLSRLMAIEEATVTNTIDRMVRDGLVLRERAADDLRRNRLKLTARGRQLRDVVVPEAKAVVDTATAGMSSAELFFLLTLMRKLQSNLLDDWVRPVSPD